MFCCSFTRWKNSADHIFHSSSTQEEKSTITMPLTMYMKDLIREDIHVNFVVDNARTVHTFEQGSPAAEIWQTVSSSIDERGLRRTELHLQSLDYAKRESRWKPSIPKSSDIQLSKPTRTVKMTRAFHTPAYGKAAPFEYQGTTAPGAQCGIFCTAQRKRVPVAA